MRYRVIFNNSSCLTAKPFLGGCPLVRSPFDIKLLLLIPSSKSSFTAKFSDAPKYDI